MADLRRLSDRVSVAPQLTEADIDALAAAGVRAVINNRPDGEAPDQPAGAAIEAAATRHGMVYRHLPVRGGAVDPVTVKAFAEVVDGADGPVVAFCRSGTRSTMVWALSQAGRQPADAIVAAAAAAGYDMNALRPYLEGMDPGARG
ncbi:MAG: TIGR01244 family sulfur transferase [Alphaproteobacteria bacterium]